MWSLRPSSKDWPVSKLLTPRSHWLCPHYIASSPWSLLGYCSPRTQVYSPTHTLHSVWNKVRCYAVRQWFSYSTRPRVHVACCSLWHEGMCRYLKSQNLWASFGRLGRAKNEVWSWLVTAFWAWPLEQTVPRPLLCFVLGRAIWSRQEISYRLSGLDIQGSSAWGRSLALSHLAIQMYLAVCSQRHICKFFKGERQ